jgi:DNA-binding transcriptional LysR family regulator
METSFLRTFLLVAATGSMAEAARRINLSATSVARQLRSLEKDFGASLPARAGRSIQLTPAGHDLLDGVRALLRSLDQLREIARSGSPAQTIKLGTIHTALHSIVPGMLMRVIRAGRANLNTSQSG